MKTFCGWVPTITGNLSFATIGQGRQPKRAFKVARASDGVRFVVVAQMRRTTDAPFLRLGDIFNWMLRREGYTVYLLFGKSLLSEDYMLLSGPCIELTPKEFKRTKTKLEPLKKEKLSDSEFETLFDRLAEEFMGYSEQPGCGLSAFELNRNGKVEINLDDSLGEKAQDLASQIYFFLRDVCHVHQHHAPTSDTILDVVPVSGGKNHWKRETLYALFRWVIQQKRSKTPTAYVDAKGVLAYARAFTEKHCCDSGSTERLPQYLRDATIESLDAGLGRAEYEEKFKGRYANILFNRILPLFGLILAFLAAFYQSPGSIGVTDQELLVAQFTEWLNDNILSVAATLLFIIVAANVSIVFRPSIFGMRIWFDLFRVLFPVPYWLVLLGLSLISMSMLILAVQSYVDLTTVAVDPGP